MCADGIGAGETSGGEATAFASHAELLVEAWQMLDARGKGDDATEPRAADLAAAWHRRFGLTGDELVFCARCRLAGLSALEREVAAVLAMGRLQLLDSFEPSCRGILDALSAQPHEVLPILQCLRDGAPLNASGMVSYDDPDEELADRQFVIDPVLIEYMLSDGTVESDGWYVETEADLYAQLAPLCRCLARRARIMDWVVSGFPPSAHADLFKVDRRLDRLFERLRRTLEPRSHWALADWLLPGRGYEGRSPSLIVTALLGKELRHVPAEDPLFTGIGLARAAAADPARVEAALALLTPSSCLVSDGVIKPCAGGAEVLGGNPDDLRDVEFELTEGALLRLDLQRSLRTSQRTLSPVRKPQIRLDQLALSSDVASALGLVAAQFRHRDVMFRKWGLGSAIPYGRGMTLLFSGPPGVGKTACAEGLAAELGLPILVADYGQMENCFVGETEKNIARTFREAAAHDAVLFLDEADAVLTSRDTAVRGWEVRSVNMLLQQIERFEGVCIIATNRADQLDAALRRRISLKVEFGRPDRAQRRQIWELLLPAQLPLAGDVNLDRLADTDLTGGEIKNAVVNAARMALTRGPQARITGLDFARAIRAELRGRQGEGTSDPIGYRPTGAL